MVSTQSSKGITFEKWVSTLYDELGKIRVKHDVTIHKKKARYQFDIVYGLFSKRYVECKYRENAKVSFSEIALFCAKLELIGASHKQGVFVTNKTYEKRARLYAKKKGVELINGKELLSLHRKRLGMLKGYFCQRNIEQIITE